MHAVSLNFASFSTPVTGLAIARQIIASIGTGPAFLLNAASFAAVLLSLRRIRARSAWVFTLVGSMKVLRRQLGFLLPNVNTSGKGLRCSI